MKTKNFDININHRELGDKRGKEKRLCEFSVFPQLEHHSYPPQITSFKHYNISLCVKFNSYLTVTINERWLRRNREKNFLRFI